MMHRVLHLVLVPQLFKEELFFPQFLVLLQILVAQNKGVNRLGDLSTLRRLDTNLFDIIVLVPLLI